MNNIISNLEEIKDQLEKTKKHYANLEGRLDEYNEQLGELGLPSVEEGEIKILKLQKEQEKLQNEIHLLYDEIVKKWNN